MSRKPVPLKEKDVKKRLEALSEWAPNKAHTQLTKTFTLQSAVNALAFVAKVLVHAEVMEHHPTFEIAEGKVKVKLKTTEAKGLTPKDFSLAKRIDRLTVGH